VKSCLVADLIPKSLIKWCGFDSKLSLLFLSRTRLIAWSNSNCKYCQSTISLNVLLFPMSDQLGFYVVIYKAIKRTFSSTFLYIKSLHYKLYYIGVIQIFIFYICVIQASQVFFQLQAISMGH